MTMWWFDPSWRNARCTNCGVRIVDTGGDPDWGYCYDCYSHMVSQQQEYESPDSPIVCSICKNDYAVCMESGFDVCSPECADEAVRRSRSHFR